MTKDAVRVLAIDRDPEVLREVETVLGEQFRCELVEDVSTARERLASGAFDAVLCDMEMPGESGLALVEDLLAERPDLAVIPLAGAQDSTAVERATELGFYGYLVKPFLPDQLLSTTQAALRRRETEAAELIRQHDLQRQIQGALDAAPVPIYVKDLERCYLFANRFAHEMAGLELGGMIGRTDDEIFSPEADAVLQESDLDVLRDEVPSYREEAVRLAGRERTFLTVKVPYFDGGGDLAGIIGVSTETTVRREAERENEELAGAQERAIEELRASRRETVEHLAAAIELHGADTGADRHVGRMARIAAYLGSHFGLDDDRAVLLRTAAPLHDIGNIAVPPEILHKPGPLTPEEQVRMERHTEVGHRILSDSGSKLMQMAARIALSHHEWFDGSGYPLGLAGEEIPIEGRIVAVADVFDALLSDRPHRRAFGAAKALDLIRAGRGTQFDPAVADLLLANSGDVLALRD
jgi:putative two-component system response regulator